MNRSSPCADGPTLPNIGNDPASPKREKTIQAVRDFERKQPRRQRDATSRRRSDRETVCRRFF